MKKTATIFAAAMLTVASTAAAQGVQGSAGVDTGLGQGLTHMVRSILGEGASSAASPETPQAAMMMSTGASLQTGAPKNAAPAMKLMAADADVRVAPAATEDDLNAFITERLRSSARVQSIDSSDTHVRLTYAVPAKLLGIVRVTMPVTGEAYVSGATSVTYPWYGGIAGIKTDIRSRFDARIAGMIATSGLTPDNRIALINEIDSFFSEEFGN